MPGKISEEKKKEIKKSYKTGISMSEIARQTGVSLTSVYGLTKLKQRINPETGEKFSSKTEYVNYQLKQRINPETGEKFSSRTEYEDYSARQRINPETGEKFSSKTEYYDYSARQRAKRKENKELSRFIKKRLKELGKNQSWLAKELGVTRQSVSFYVYGRNIPEKENLNKLLNILDSDKNNKTSKKTISLEELFE